MTPETRDEKQSVSDSGAVGQGDGAGAAPVPGVAVGLLEDARHVHALVLDLYRRMARGVVAVLMLAIPIMWLSYQVTHGFSIDAIGMFNWVRSWNVGDDVLGISLGVAGTALTLWIAVSLAISPTQGNGATTARARVVVLDGITTATTFFAAVCELLLVPAAITKNGLLTAAVPAGLSLLLAILAPIGPVPPDVRLLELQKLVSQLARASAALASGPVPRRPGRLAQVGAAMAFLSFGALGGAATLLGILSGAISGAWWAVAMLMVFVGAFVGLWAVLVAEIGCSARARWVTIGARAAFDPFAVLVLSGLVALLFASLLSSGGLSLCVAATPLVLWAMPLTWFLGTWRARSSRQGKAAWLIREKERLEASMAFQMDRLRLDSQGVTPSRN